ncbi:MAG: tetratricopeptide repeat protein [Pseudomonadota bacterium]
MTLNLEGFEREVCTNNDAEAFCVSMDQMLKASLRRDPDTLVKDTPEALLSAVDYGCQQGSLRACLAASSMVSHSRGTKDFNHIDLKPDFDRSLQYDFAACDLGQYFACNTIKNRYFDGQGLNKSMIERDPAAFEGYARRRGQIETYLLDRCEDGHMGSCGRIGWNYGLFGHSKLKQYGVEPKIDEALRLLNKACEGGHAESCQNLSDLYREGNKVEVDTEVAENYSRLGCEAGGQPACLALYRVYQETDAAKAREYLKMGCGKTDFEKDPDSLQSLGDYLCRGL